MIFNFPQLAGIALSYLSVLFVVAIATEKGLIPVRVIRHPITYVLSLGVYASAFAVYGVVGLAGELGLTFMVYYLGIALCFFLAPILLSPILRLTRNYQLTSLADLFAFRYRSQLVGSLVTLLMLAGMLPLLTLQIRTIAEAFSVLNNQSNPDNFALLFVVILIVFTMAFGTRHFNSREKHEGMVVAMAFESLFKLVCLVVIALYGLFTVFGGVIPMQKWLEVNPEHLANLYEPLIDKNLYGLTLAFFSAAITMPHLFQMTFTENINPRNLLVSSYGFPIFLFLLALCVPIILWAGIASNAPTEASYYSLGLGMVAGNKLLIVLAFLAGLSAASGIMIITTMTLAAMLLNHVVFPTYQPSSDQNLYRWLRYMRQALIIIILLSTYAFYRLSFDTGRLVELATLSFVALLQFLPGVVGVIFWGGGNRRGLITGLILGYTIWCFGMLVPFLSNSNFFFSDVIAFNLMPSLERWNLVATLAVLVNAAAFVLVSFFTRTTQAEKNAAEICTTRSLRTPYRWELSVTSVREIINRLTIPLGQATAKREVELALDDLAMSVEETRPYSLRRLRNRLEINLSGLLGPSVAQEIVDNSLPYKTHTDAAKTEDIQFIENRVEEYQDRLTGLAAELDGLRRFHRQTLEDLPIAVCSFGSDLEIISWNREMELLTNTSSALVMGSSLARLPQPWQGLIEGFIAQNDRQEQQSSLVVRGQRRWLSLHKAAISRSTQSPGVEKYKPASDVALVIEDYTNTKLLEEKFTHNERLASVGRLAAGVAHEIGNPITGIDCLAQELKAESKSDEVKAVAVQILGQTKRVSSILNSLMSFSHRGGQRHQDASEVPVSQCINEAIKLIQLNPDAKELNICLDCDEDLKVMGDEQKLQQVFINILSNAAFASPRDGVIDIAVQALDEAVTVNVTDYGSGIEPGLLPTLFEPFVTSKDPGEGTGLGLAVVHSIIEDHYGNISISSPLENGRTGTRVTIQLPRCYPY